MPNELWSIAWYDLWWCTKHAEYLWCQLGYSVVAGVREVIHYRILGGIICHQQIVVTRYLEQIHADLGPWYWCDVMGQHRFLLLARFGLLTVLTWLFYEFDVLPDKSSIFTAEMYALLIAFQQIEKSTKKHFIIFFGFKISFTGPSVERLDKSTDFTTAWTTPFLVYNFG